MKGIFLTLRNRLLTTIHGHNTPEYYTGCKEVCSPYCFKHGCLRHHDRNEMRLERELRKGAEISLKNLGKK